MNKKRLELPELLSQQVIDKAKKLSSSLLADAMGERGAMHHSIKPVSNSMKTVGTAYTVELRVGDNLFLHEAIYQGGEGYVLIANGKGHTDSAYLGELMAGAAKAVGLEGLVIDGCVRDRNALEELGLPIFSIGYSPNGPYKDGPGELLSQIACGGAAVNPGDLILGDEDGVVVVPQDKIEDILLKAEKKLGYEEKRLATIANYVDDPASVQIEPDWLEEKMAGYYRNK
ncbi:RraA family protein [Salicibibacter cibarius]|uniref:Putative 4-hydroxy-4-methyl-2-oxoglutarate aldolase n=1 Tax=Salicibibacter cibarius TaxID=2743000 RepID=A0A7T6Z6I3_9BACI|nr:RraA family protein [Salicibibacter cibarius]QQK77722.1 RraA family protein [Salicibibacter cibarius]